MKYNWDEFYLNIIFKKVFDIFKIGKRIYSTHSSFLSISAYIILTIIVKNDFFLFLLMNVFRRIFFLPTLMALIKIYSINVEIIWDSTCDSKMQHRLSVYTYYLYMIFLNLFFYYRFYLFGTLISILALSLI